jgi:hypothetical protein
VEAAQYRVVDTVVVGGFVLVELVAAAAEPTEQSEHSSEAEEAVVARKENE